MFSIQQKSTEQSAQNDYMWRLKKGHLHTCAAQMYQQCAEDEVLNNNGDAASITAIVKTDIKMEIPSLCHTLSMYN